MKKICAAILCGLVMAPAHGFAADLGASPIDYGSSGGQMVEIGTGWYIRGDIGASFDSKPTLSLGPSALATPPGPTIAPLIGANSLQTDFVGGVGVGYKFNNYFRMDATFDYISTHNFDNITPGIVCPYNMIGLLSQTRLDASGSPLKLGYAYNTNDTCNANTQIQQNNYLTLLNGYYDIFTYWGVTPYVGAGAGVNIQTSSGYLNYTTTSNNSPYRADLSPISGFPLVWLNPVTGKAITPQPTIAFGQQNWDRSFKSTKYNLAISLTAGVGIALTPNATLDLSYRYLNLGTSSYVINPLTGATVSQHNIDQQIRVGLRYIPN